VPPSQYLLLPYPAWCETDCLLDRAVAEHDRRLCGCGCGWWASESHGDANEGEFAVEEDVCHARAAMDRHLKDQKERTPGALLYTRLKVDGED
jgi:hypothetical protein